MLLYRSARLTLPTACAPRHARREVVLGALALGAGMGGSVSARGAAAPRPVSPRPLIARAAALIAAARRQIGVTRGYDPAYTALAYPGGDVPRANGVCCDVVIRAYRDALGLDLQRFVHQDMAAHFAAYPRRWGLARPDASIDHRRVPNLERFWDRAGARLPLPANPAGWRPGDVFTGLVAGRLPHTGIVSDRIAANGHPLVIHNIGRGAQEEDMLGAFPLVGRFRWRV